MIGQKLVLSATDVLKAGFVAHPAALGVFNSQFTAFRRELAPCFAQFYKWQGRNTDIMASLIMRRVMREMNLYTYYGPPTGFHARTQRDPLKDLKAEIWGLEHVAEFAAELDKWEMDLTSQSVAHAVRFFYSASKVIPEGCHEAAMAFLDDIEGAL